MFACFLHCNDALISPGVTRRQDKGWGVRVWRCVLQDLPAFSGEDCIKRDEINALRMLNAKTDWHPIWNREVDPKAGPNYCGNLLSIFECVGGRILNSLADLQRKPVLLEGSL
ncbi:MAG: hypothetical protein ACXWUD_10560 [Methylosarcina sp.]